MPLVEVNNQVIDFPDDMTEEQITTAIERDIIPQQKTASAPPPTGQAFMKGVDIARLPYDLAKRALQSAGLGEQVKSLEETAGAMGRGFEQGATLGLQDEAKAVIGAAIASPFVKDRSFGELYDESRGIQEKQLKQDIQESPVATIAGGLTGGVLGAGGAAGLTGLAKVAPKAAKWLTQSSGFLTARAKDALQGAVTGAAAGAGMASPEQDRLAGAVVGGTTGFFLSPIVGAGMAGVGSGIKKAGKVLEKQLDNLAIKEAVKNGELLLPEELPIGLKKIADKLKSDYPNPDDYKKELYKYLSTDKSLLEVGGERLKNLAEGAALFPSGQARTVDFFKGKVSSSPENLKKALSKTISPNVNYYDTLDVLLETGRQKAKPLYQRAFKDNKSISSPLIDKILETPQGKMSLSEAVKDVQNEMSLVAKPDKELSDIYSDLVSVGKAKKVSGGIGRGLNLKTHDYIKKSMDSSINKAFKSGDEAEAKRIINLKNSYVSELDNLDKTGLYKKARATSGEYLSSKEAMENGLAFLKQDADIIERTYKSYNKAQKEAYKIGAVKSLRGYIDNKMDGRNVANIFDTFSAKQKLKAILSESEYKKLISQAADIDKIYKLRNQLTGNSRTKLRDIAAQEFSPESEDILTEITSKTPTKILYDKLLQSVRKRFSDVSDETAEDVAKILYETDTKKKYQIVKSLINDVNKKSDIRKTEAANKLALFYGISDKLTKLKTSEQSPTLLGVAKRIGQTPAGEITIKLPDLKGAEGKIPLVKEGSTIKPKGQ